MARPLQKRRPDGTPYTRPQQIESAIDDVLALDPAERIARAELRDRGAAGFLPKEVLVHLIREAKRNDDQTSLNRLFKILLHRCEAILLHQVPDSYPHAWDIRADTLSRLGELVAIDESGTDPYRLDFFEVRFEQAFLLLRQTVGRKYLRRSAREIVAADPDNPAREPLPEALETEGEQEPTVLRKQQLALFNKLPAADRLLLRQRFLNEIKVESKDPNEFTLARVYEVDGRTIRNRIAAALKRLAELEKEK